MRFSALQRSCKVDRFLFHLSQQNDRKRDTYHHRQVMSSPENAILRRIAYNAIHGPLDWLQRNQIDQDHNT